MKKKIKALLCVIFSCICFMTIGCRPLVMIYHPPKVEWDGRFLYYYVNSKGATPHYRILGTEPELGVKSEVLDKLYIPSHYKGLRVDGYSGTFRGYDEELETVVEHKFGIDITPVKELYRSYNESGPGFLGESNFYKSVVPRISAAEYISQTKTTSEFLTIYIPNIAYNIAYNGLKRFGATILTEKNSEVYYLNSGYEQESCIKKANTAYMFNYEGSPNEDYYFINDFERGGLIENTPYEPFREGYEFCGWYKESECKTKWDFITDVLPEPTYDENGELEYVETKLYAKWNKI